MIQYHNGYPIFISTSNTLDLTSLHTLVKFLHPIIIKNFKKDAGYEQDDLTSRHLYYNLLSIKQACIYELYKFIVISIKEFLMQTNVSYNNLYIQVWANLTTKNTQIVKHKHTAFLNGHIGINAEPSSTFYLLSDTNADIKNKNGQLCITISDLDHFTSIWEQHEPRTTIAFEVIKDITNTQEVAFINFYPLYLE